MIQKIILCRIHQVNQKQRRVLNEVWTDIVLPENKVLFEYKKKKEHPVRIKKIQFDVWVVGGAGGCWGWDDWLVLSFERSFSLAAS